MPLSYVISTIIFQCVYTPKLCNEINGYFFSQRLCNWAYPDGKSQDWKKTGHHDHPLCCLFQVHFQHTHILTHAHVHTRAHMHTHTQHTHNTHTHTYIHMYHTHTCTNPRMHTQHTDIYSRMHTPMHHTHLCRHMHTHTRTHTHILNTSHQFYKPLLTSECRRSVSLRLRWPWMLVWESRS